MSSHGPAEVTGSSAPADALLRSAPLPLVCRELDALESSARISIVGVCAGITTSVRRSAVASDHGSAADAAVLAVVPSDGVAPASAIGTGAVVTVGGVVPASAALGAARVAIGAASTISGCRERPRTSRRLRPSREKLRCDCESRACEDTRGQCPDARNARHVWVSPLSPSAVRSSRTFSRNLFNTLSGQLAS